MTTLVNAVTGGEAMTEEKDRDEARGDNMDGEMMAEVEDCDAPFGAAMAEEQDCGLLFTSDSADDQL